MDHINILMTIVVDNMVGKLKVACNKFIVNKFLMSAINYKNVSDYIAKINMRRKRTWGTDVELFAAAVLFQTDIWVFSSDIGKKWMVFSVMGAKFIEALESPPVNNAGSIYLNHNGAHYEPILNVCCS